MVICGRLFCRTFKPSPRSAFQQDRRISRTFCVVNTTRELDKSDEEDGNKKSKNNKNNSLNEQNTFGRSFYHHRTTIVVKLNCKDSNAIVAFFVNGDRRDFDFVGNTNREAQKIIKKKK